MKGDVRQMLAGVARSLGISNGEEYH